MSLIIGFLARSCAFWMCFRPRYRLFYFSCFMFLIIYLVPIWHIITIFTMEIQIYNTMCSYFLGQSPYTTTSLFTEQMVTFRALLPARALIYAHAARAILGPAFRGPIEPAHFLTFIFFLFFVIVIVYSSPSASCSSYRRSRI